MSIELAVSLLALLVAAASAIYARSAASQSALANRISAHQPRSEILDSFLRFKGAFAIDGEDAEQSLFYSLTDSANRSNLYFTQPVSDHLESYSHAAFAVLIARDHIRRMEAMDRHVASEKWQAVYELVDACREAEGDLLSQLQAQTKLVD